jgi:hypothetical protein
MMLPTFIGIYGLVVIGALVAKPNVLTADQINLLSRQLEVRCRDVAY